MTRFRYRTATTLTGQLADELNSLAWLFAVEAEDVDLEADHQLFLDGIGVIVQGSTTYEWVLAETGVLDEPGRWPSFYGDRPSFVFSSRDLPIPDRADVRVVRGDVADHLDAILAAAGRRDVWLVGGGDLVAQFDAAGALDEITVTIAPVTLSGGAPLLPRRIESDRLQLRDVRRLGPFVEATYDLDGDQDHDMVAPRPRLGE